MNDNFFMKKAIDLSAAAVAHGNEPFGAVLVKDGEIVFTNENQIYTRHDPTFHGEAGLIREFCAQTGITDLHEYTMYASCEPCFMCSGAMVWVKLGRLVYGAGNDDLETMLGNRGCNCSAMVFENSFWQPQVTSGVLREESLAVLRACFSEHKKGEKSAAGDSLRRFFLESGGHSISRRLADFSSLAALGRISSSTPLSYLALMAAVSMPVTLKVRL